MTFLQLQHKIKALIAKNETKEALESLRTSLRGNKWENMVIVGLSRYNTQLAETLRGTISWEQANVGRNQLHSSILELVQELVTLEIKETKVFISYH